ncbi:tetratricopeptide repeat protein [Fontisphaera persica]|uniref:tetratricopeptide repeat protein n=1 Tax=Fontisphaera persica TaxID=2974023 RepID=UPI0024C002FD|nr:tetratricopeptide repeat protein [Fontisphaera persica]WCJ58420.1 tetratricopeptide repeat protein [Fontisphaera persica]
MPKPKPQSAAASGSNLARPARRRLGIKILVMALPLLVFLALEAVLRLVGYGHPTDFFLPAVVQGRPVWVENHQFGWRFFPPRIARAPQPMVVDQVKPPGTVRIVILGESAAMGDPEPAYGFGRYLEVLLSEAFPDKKFEVINAAMTAINSHVIRLIARDCVKLDADFWVLYMGNNEVVGPYGSGTVFGRQAPDLPLIRAALFFRTLKTGQLAEACLQQLRAGRAAQAEWGGLEMFLEHKLAPDDPRMQRVYRHFENNLTDILETGRRAGARVVVSTVSANWKDCAPFASLHRSDMTAAELEVWQNAVREGARLAAAGQHQQALAHFQEAYELDRDHAELEYRIAEAKWALKQFREARGYYQWARDMDALRFRVDTRLNEITRAVAGSRTNQNVYLVDAERVLSRAAPNQTPGRELFYDHVHLNFAGNYALARAIAAPIAAALAPAGRTSWLAPQEAQDRLAATAFDQLQVWREMRRRLQRPPFTQQLNHTAQIQWVDEQIAALRPQTSVTQGLPPQASVYQQALARRPNDATLLARYARLLEEAGDLNGALQQWEKVGGLLPHDYQAEYFQGLLWRNLGRLERAREHFQRVLQLRPNVAEAWNGLGLCEMDEGRLAEALASFDKALARRPTDADFHYNKAIVHARASRTHDAMACYRQALAMAPEHTSARYNLANLLIRQGQWAEAEKELQTLLQHAPDHARARNNYGLALLRLRRPAEAVEQFRQTLRYEPDNAEARLNLANALLTLKQWDEAIAHLEAFLAAHPGHPAAQQRLAEARALRAAGQNAPAP